MNNRLAITIVTSLLILFSTLLLIQFAKGYRPDLQTRSLKATGLLVATSEPQGAQVIINQQLITATDDTINLDPGDYKVEIKKEGYIDWNKDLHIYKELVTQSNALLFPITPNLQSLTNTGALNPSLSPNGTKLIYVIPNENITNPSEATISAQPQNNTTKEGIWLLELTNLPLGFNQEPQQLVAGNPPLPKTPTATNHTWNNARFQWSPDSREILAIFEESPPKLEKAKIKEQPTATPSGVFLINANSQNQPASQLSNIKNQYPTIISDWASSTAKLLNDKVTKLPLNLQQLIATTAADLKFSPDETKMLYTATGSAKLADAYINSIPAASTQTQNRQLESQQTYVYDIKEDRNFLILNKEQTTALQECSKSTENDQLRTNICPKLIWFPTSSHLIYFTDKKISIMEYDSTNNQVIYAGPIERNFVFPYPFPSKLLLVTNLNPDGFPLPNLYTLSLK